MSEAERLKAALTRLATPSEIEPGKGRVLAPRGGDGFLGAILQEIDETVLARQLQFRTAQGLEIVFDVANRRLLRVRKLAGNMNDTKDGELINRPLGENEGLIIETLRDRLEQMLEGTDRLFVTSTAANGTADASDIGCSSEVLAKIWGIALHSRDPVIESHLLDRFVEACTPLSTAAILIDALGVAQKMGDEQTLARLDRLAGREPARIRQCLDRCFPGQASPAYIATLDTGNSPDTVFYGSGSGVQVLLAAPGRNRPEILAVWKGLSDTAAQ